MRDLTAVKAALAQHEIELPSWAFGSTGTRFKVFGQPALLNGRLAGQPGRAALV